MTGGAETVRGFSLRKVLADHSALGRQAAWIVGPLLISQVLRLGTNLVLARLLAPEIFGVMLLVNTLRTGAELLSDLGIGQSVVRSANGEDRRFLDVAWTIQLLRGIGLSLIAVAAAAPVARIYGHAELVPILLAVSPIFLLTGLQSPSLFLVQRQIRLRAKAILDLIYIVFHCAFSIALAYVMPTVWALVWALLASTAVSTILSFLVTPRVRPRIAWDRTYVHEIVHFGKWIFLATAIYFAASSYDRIYFVAVLPLAMAGVYSVARTFADMVGMIALHGGNSLIFPKVAQLKHDDREGVARLRAARTKVLLLMAIACGLAIAGSDQFILLAYDARYHAAAFMLPVLMASVWFGVLATFDSSILMGRGRPAPTAWSNAAKFAVMLIGLPFATARMDMLLALLVLTAAEFARWLTLAPLTQREGFASSRDDLALTLLVAVLAIGTKLTLGSIGLVPTISEWWAMRGLLHV